MTKGQGILILLMAVVAGLILAGLLTLYTNTQGVDANALIPVSNDAFGGAYTLIDHNGKTVTEQDFRGRYQLIYFGFTFCPAICPTELAKMKAALGLLPPHEEALIQPLFITVDPERDTVDVMKNYVSLFHPRLIGLTGTLDQVQPVLKNYKIYASKTKDPSMTEYTMDHSSFIYFIAPDGRLLHIFKMQDGAQTMTNTIMQWMDKESDQK